MYLIVNHWSLGTYYTTAITRDDLIARKAKDCDHIINLTTLEEFNPDENRWEKVKEKVAE